MAWWSENFPWIVGVIGGPILLGIGTWVIRRLFTSTRKAPQPWQEADAGSQPLEASQPGDVVVTRRGRGRGRGPRMDAGRPRAGATLLKLGLGAVASALFVGVVLYGIALLKGVPITALPAPLVYAVAGSVVALWILFGGVYALGRMVMGRRARQHGVRVASGVSSYRQSLELYTDETAALAQGVGAILALRRGAELDSESDTPGQIVGRTGMSGRSFGEIISIRVQPTTSRRTTIEIQSQPANWQLFDGGINAENVAGIVRYLEGRGSPVAQREPAADEAPAPKHTLLPTRDWFALAYLAALVGYTGLLIALKELWPGTFAAWAGWLDAVPLDPLRLVGDFCPAADPAASHSVALQLNILILPTLLAYGAYNTYEFHRKLDRMDALTWMFSIVSLVILPLLVLTSCSADGAEELALDFRWLFGFMLENSGGAALYALMLVSFTNGVSFLPALALSRLFATKSKSGHRRR